MIVEITEYKGHKLLSIKKDEDDKYPFQFGLAKAKKVIECIDHIKNFVHENDKPKDTNF